MTKIIFFRKVPISQKNNFFGFLASFYKKHPLRLIGDPLLILLILIFTFPAQSQIYSLQLQGLFTPQLFIPKKVDRSVPFFQNQCPLFGKIIDASFRSFFNPILELNDITSSSFLGSGPVGDDDLWYHHGNFHFFQNQLRGSCSTGRASDQAG